MTKEFTGAEFEIEFARAWLACVEGGKVGVDPRTQWEHKVEITGNEWLDHATFPMCNGITYRWKPVPKRLVTIGYWHVFKQCWISKELVAPEVEAPPEDTVIYAVEAISEKWCGDVAQLNWLKQGRVFLTREDAAAMAEWLAVCRKGGAA